MVGEKFQEHYQPEDRLPEPEVTITIKVPLSKHKHIKGLLCDLLDAKPEIRIQEKNRDHA